MIPNTLAEAKASGASKYNTGKSCRNGHMSDRYTQSGACQQCIASANKSATSKSSGIIAPGSERQKSREQLVELRLRAYPQHLAQLRDTVLAMTCGKSPALLPLDVFANRPPTDGQAGTALYKFHVHCEDVPFFRGVAGNLLNQNGADVDAIRRATFGVKSEQAAIANTCPVPEFTP